MSEYNQLKGQLTAANRKQTGSLAVRDLTGIVKPSDSVNTENLITLFTVVSKHDKAEWLKTYETLSDFVVRTTCPRPHDIMLNLHIYVQHACILDSSFFHVVAHVCSRTSTGIRSWPVHTLTLLFACQSQVPRSSKLIYEDNDYSLYSVTLFKRVADSFKAAARSKGYQASSLSS